jgi:hypothetical protein
MGQSKGCLVKSVPGTEDGKKRAWHRRLAPKIGTEDQGCLHGCRAPKIAGHRRSHKGCQARLALGIVPGDAWQPVLDSPNDRRAGFAFGHMKHFIFHHFGAISVEYWIKKRKKGG